MPSGDKPYFQFIKGINTEASLVNFPEDYSVDEENYDLFIDATRRKRKGIAAIAGGDLVSLVNNLSGASGTFYWDSVGGNSTIRFIVKQRGSRLFFYSNDSSLISPSAGAIGSIDLVSFKLSTAVLTDVINSEVDMAFGRGKGVCVGKYIDPFLIQYNPNYLLTSPVTPFTTSVIGITERDFKGVDDGLDMNQTTTAVLTADQTYNLTNRGWTDADITTFKTAMGYYPSKNFIPHLGYRGKDAAGAASTIAQADWTKEFSPAKLVAELFQNVSAPQGHLKITPFVNSLPLSTSGPTISPTTWTISSTSAGTSSLTLTTAAAHGLLVADNIYWTGQTKFYYLIHGFGDLERRAQRAINFSGSYVITAVTATTLTINVILSSAWDLFEDWATQYYILGTITKQSYVLSNPRYSLGRPEVTAFWAGRAWYMGIDDNIFSSKIYVSQILETDAQYGLCHQTADPTDERISDLVDSDGGVIYIPEMATARRALIVGSYLIVFATNGVWQIGPGQAGFFSMRSYSIRKIADSGIIGKKACALVDQVPYYCSQNDIWRFVQDVQTGQLNPDNISQLTIHKLFTGIPNKVYIKMLYDTLAKKVWFLYSNNASYTYAYDRAIVLDVRLSAFTKHSFIMSGYYVTDISTIHLQTDQALKLLIDTFNTSTNLASFSRFNNTVYQDLGTTYTCYILTSYEVAQTAVIRKTASYVHVFHKRSETGFVDAGTEYTPVNDSTTKMQARWDWADASIAGKWGMPQETYRHRRIYTPDITTPTVYADGVPLVISKNLIRGTGRALQLYFSNSDSTKDSFLVGWNVHYNITGNVT